jgi:hypothetical protein
LAEGDRGDVDDRYHDERSRDFDESVTGHDSLAPTDHEQVIIAIADAEALDERQSRDVLVAAEPRTRLSRDDSCVPRREHAVGRSSRAPRRIGPRPRP